MLSEHVVQDLPRLRAKFRDARPFRHIRIDRFLDAAIAERLLAEFPPFDPEKALNEMGEVGPKCVHENLPAISPFYADFYDYISSREFLGFLSDLTGIPDLLFDPAMYGGGAHDNRDGAELYPHVDFNYDSATGRHRRINLLIYLNKGWQQSWGGAIELHSNPVGWFDGTNEISVFNVDFNRAVIFETNEHSWHGFPQIHLPPDQRDSSRKLISVYLYTETRPEEEIAPPHGTFYYPYPMPESVRPGEVLSERDYLETRAALYRRDGLLQLAYTNEKNLNAEIQVLRRHNRELASELRKYSFARRWVKGLSRLAGR